MKQVVFKEILSAYLMPGSGCGGRELVRVGIIIQDCRGYAKRRICLTLLIKIYQVHAGPVVVTIFVYRIPQCG